MADDDHRSNRAQQCPHNKSRSQTTADEDNYHPPHPLVIFKRFVDDQFNAITNLPYLRQNYRHKMELETEARKRRDISTQYRWTGYHQTSDHVDYQVSRLSAEEKNDAFDAAVMLVKESELRNKTVDPARIRALYQDDEWNAEHDPFRSPMLSFGGACYYMPETGKNLPSTASLQKEWPHSEWFRSSPRWLSIDWFKHSRYSPIQLEAKDDSAKWRIAFEDLLLSSLGKPLTTDSFDMKVNVEGYRPNQMILQNYRLGPGLDWMLSLQCRGILPPQLPSLYRRNAGRTYLDFESIRTRWQDLAPSWASPSLDNEFADLVREIATPASTDGQGFGAFVFEGCQPTHPFKTILPSSEPVDDLAEFDEELHQARLDGRIFSSTEAEKFWLTLAKQDTTLAAKQIQAWEENGNYVDQLIDDLDITHDYILTDTSPVLWPLCEALEKADSALYQLRQEWNDTRDRSPDSPPSQILAQLSQQLDDSDGGVPAFPTPQHDALQSRTQRTDASTQTSEEKSIIAMLTTTQTTTLPDGTVTTKTVLKKRFVDGTEENTESVRVEHPQAQKNEETSDKSSKKGWFWS